MSKLYDLPTRIAAQQIFLMEKDYLPKDKEVTGFFDKEIEEAWDKFCIETNGMLSSTSFNGGFNFSKMPEPILEAISEIANTDIKFSIPKPKHDMDTIEPVELIEPINLQPTTILDKLHEKVQSALSLKGSDLGSAGGTVSLGTVVNVRGDNSAPPSINTEITDKEITKQITDIS